MKALATLFHFKTDQVQKALRNDRIIWFTDDDGRHYIIYHRNLMPEKEEFACYMMLKENCDLKTAEYYYQNGHSDVSADMAFIKALNSFPQESHGILDINGKGYQYAIIDAETNKYLLKLSKK